MAAPTTYAQWLARLETPDQIVRRGLSSIATGVSGQAVSYWKAGNPAGATITTAAVPTAATDGALRDPRIFNAVGQLCLSRMHFSFQTPGYGWLVDRLSHQGGLSGTLNGTDSTTNLPTAALTRYTSGDGVMGCAEIYNIIGTTGQTFTVAYTDQGGSASTSEAREIGGTGDRELGRCLLIPLASGDSGMRAIQSITTTGSTGTAGAYGFTLFKPLAAFSVPGVNSQDFTWDLIANGGSGVVNVEDDACLQLIWFPTVIATGNASIDFEFLDV